MRNSARAGNSAAGTKFRRFHFLLFSAILSSWFLIYNAEFDSNSLCLDRLNNFGIISSQKLQNLPQKMRLVHKKHSKPIINRVQNSTFWALINYMY